MHAPLPLRPLFLLLAILWWPLSVADARPPFRSDLGFYLDQLERSGFSGSILVEREGSTLIRSFGLADREFGIRNSARTKFKIGSVTKQFTAMAILLLVKDGRLSLDDRVCRFIQACPTAWQSISIRELLNHSSGIPDFVKLPEMRGRFTQPMDLNDTITMLERQPLDFPPGSEARYGNSGFLVSAWIIQRVSGKSYAAFLDERIYRPLGMNSSGYAADGPIIFNRARGYVRRGGLFENAPFIDMSIPVGAGSQYSTVLDLYRWDRAMRGHQLIPDVLTKEMFSPGKGNFGLGWDIVDDEGRRVAEHVGDINGFGAFIARWLNDDAVIIILTNIEDTRKVREIRNGIVARLFN
jgi:D-alanyl-D-alanine carboxypeptidase